MEEAHLLSSLDIGCHVATLFLRITGNHENSKCTNNCPFPDCVSSLSYHDKKVLNKSKELRELLNLYDNGINLSILCRRFKIDYAYATQCIKNRDHVQELLDKWGDILKYKEQVKQFQIVSV